MDEISMTPPTAARTGAAMPLEQIYGTPMTVSSYPTAYNYAGFPEDGQTPQSTAAQSQQTAQTPQPGALVRPVTLQLEPDVSRDVVEAPLTTQEAFAGSMKMLLGKNIGHYIVASFLVGTQAPVSWEGFLHSVGNDYIVIFQPDMGRFLTCDLYSLKFVEFHDQKGVIPQCPGMRRRDGAAIW